MQIKPFLRKYFGWVPSAIAIACLVLALGVGMADAFFRQPMDGSKLIAAANKVLAADGACGYGSHLMLNIQIEDKSIESAPFVTRILTVANKANSGQWSRYGFDKDGGFVYAEFSNGFFVVEPLYKSQAKPVYRPGNGQFTGASDYVKPWLDSQNLKAHFESEVELLEELATKIIEEKAAGH